MITPSSHLLIMLRVPYCQTQASPHGYCGACLPRPLSPPNLCFPVKVPCRKRSIGRKVGDELARGSSHFLMPFLFFGHYKIYHFYPFPQIALFASLMLADTHWSEPHTRSSYSLLGNVSEQDEVEENNNGSSWAGITEDNVRWDSDRVREDESEYPDAEDYASIREEEEEDDDDEEEDWNVVEATVGASWATDGEGDDAEERNGGHFTTRAPR